MGVDHLARYARGTATRRAFQAEMRSLDPLRAWDRLGLHGVENDRSP